MDNIEQYDEYTALYDGVLGDCVLVNPETDTIIMAEMWDVSGTLTSWLADLALDAGDADDDDDHCIIEVYRTRHYHSPDYDGECACAQYLTDHHPDYTFGGYEDE